jgi:precorrin-6Y C5,15-methyltransferase (decarboxylating)
MTSDHGSGGGGRVLVVGVGDDGPAGLPPGVLRRVHRADLLVGGRRHLEMFSDVAAERLAIAGGLEDVVQQVDAASAERQVVVLASGDPCFFGIGPLLASRLGRERVEIVPHVSSVALAFARLGLAWHDARVVSAHGRPLDQAVRASHGARKLAVLTDEANTPAVVAEAMLTAGADDARTWVFEHLGGARERQTASTLRRLRCETFEPLNVLVVPDLTWTARCRSIGFGLAESTYEHTAGQITKAEVRAISLSKLRLRPGGVLWDVGAGSGSLAIEAAGLAPGLRVYAVERSEKRLPLLRRNVDRLVTGGNVTVIEGTAPGALGSLPDPDAVFVGGSGGRLLEILEAARCRMRSSGRIVANLVTFEHQAAIFDWARSRSLTAEVVQIGVARGTDVVGLTRLQAENPVTIVTLQL